MQVRKSSMSRFVRSALRSSVACLALVTLLRFSGVPLAAQSPRDAAPVPLVPASPRSPDVHADGSVSFRLVMASATNVELHLEGAAQPFPMAKGADNTWAVTVPKLAPQYYSYGFKVDGSDVLDPHNTTLKTSFFSTQNVFLVPGTPAKPWEPADVPHGTLHHHFYKSAIVGINSEYYVYTPPGFDPKSGQKY